MLTSPGAITGAGSAWLADSILLSRRCAARGGKWGLFRRSRRVLKQQALSWIFFFFLIKACHWVVSSLCYSSCPVLALCSPAGPRGQATAGCPCRSHLLGHSTTRAGTSEEAQTYLLQEKHVKATSAAFWSFTATPAGVRRTDERGKITIVNFKEVLEHLLHN